MSTITTDNRALSNAIQKAGLLPEPKTAYLGLNRLSAFHNDLLAALGSGKELTMRGVHSITLDPEIALQPGVTTLLELTIKSGLPVPNDELEILQYDAHYLVTEHVMSPKDIAGDYLEIIRLTEVTRSASPLFSSVQSQADSL